MNIYPERGAEWALRSLDLPKTLSLFALAAFVAGGALGIAAHGSDSILLATIGTWLSPIGTIWVNALRMAVVPLVIAYVIVAISSVGDARRTGALAGLSLLAFAGLLALAAPFGLLLGRAAAAGYAATSGESEPFRATATDSTLVSTGAAAEPQSLIDSLISLVPPNIFRAAAGDQILPLVVVAVLFGLAVTRISPDHRQLLVGFFKATAEALTVLIAWILKVMPLGVFALAFAITREAGFAVAGAFGYWMVVASVILLLFAALLYPIAVVVARVPLARFAAAVGPAQLVAAGSRSSLACLPPLLEGARTQLNIPDSCRGFVLPLSSSTFKLSGTVGSPFQLFLLAHLYGIELNPVTVTVFMLGIMLMSFGTPGIPSAGLSVRLPMFLGAGIPIDGFMLMHALDAIPDMFKTAVNVTGDMTVVAVVARWWGDGRTGGQETVGSADRP